LRRNSNRAGLRAFATEDKPMLEAVQAAMGDVEFWAMKPAMLDVDAGAVRARMRLKASREAESG
jgi:vanillate O-demethylase monooxygenase subunit